MMTLMPTRQAPTIGASTTRTGLPPVALPQTEPLTANAADGVVGLGYIGGSATVIGSGTER
jgi:hypothetical protein